MNTLVSFELAKLLKEKGFDEPCKLCVEDGDKRPLPFDCGNTIHRNSLHPYYSAPSISEVIMWLYEKHEIWISVHKTTEVKWSNNYFNYAILSPKGTVYSDIGGTQPNTPTEAYEAGIEYCLTKLTLDI